MTLSRYLVGLTLLLLAVPTPAAEFVRVSPRDPRYFELSDGRPYLPIGLNLIAPDAGSAADGAPGLQQMDEWMRQLAAQDGNFVRVWLSSPFWAVEHERAGAYDQTKAKRIDAMLDLARKHGLRVKMTLEHFRSIEDPPRQRWAHQPLHHLSRGGTATNLAQWFAGDASRTQFQRKLAWFANRYGSNPTVFGWELWNEVNAVQTSEHYFLPWTEFMLAELHRRFPQNLAMQSLGSFDTDRVRDLYRRHSRLRGNDVAQVHRYLDLGASLEICHGPMDILAAAAVEELLAFAPGRPVILAESGAVEPRHTGPFKLYAKDRAGMLLHDVLFAPFFAGAAGAGQIWHWNHYVERNHLWHHFGRFAAAVKDLDPPAEQFQPVRLAHPQLRVYGLRGRHTLLAWCRDTANTWHSELAENQPPRTLTGLKLDLTTLLATARPKRARAYDPWSDRWQDLELDGPSATLPDFSRSLVLQLQL